MSHFTRLTTKIVEKDFLTQALEELGFTWEEGDLSIRGFTNEQERAEIKVTSPRVQGEIGFRRLRGGAEDRLETYEIVADWSTIRGTTAHKFQREVMQRYAYHATRARLEAQGFTLVSEENHKAGEVHLVLRRAA